MINHARIKTLREKAGLTQDAAAHLAGFGSRQAWNHIETGRRKDVTLKTLERIAAALKCKPRDLLTE